MKTLLKENILEPTNGRKLTQFEKFNRNPLAGLNWEQLSIWIDKKKNELLTFKCSIGEGNLSDSDATDIESDDENV